MLWKEHHHKRKAPFTLSCVCLDLRQNWGMTFILVSAWLGTFMKNMILSDLWQRGQILCVFFCPIVMSAHCASNELVFLVMSNPWTKRYLSSLKATFKSCDHHNQKCVKRTIIFEGLWKENSLKHLFRKFSAGVCFHRKRWRNKRPKYFLKDFTLASANWKRVRSSALSCWARHNLSEALMAGLKAKMLRCRRRVHRRMERGWQVRERGVTFPWRG